MKDSHLNYRRISSETESYIYNKKEDLLGRGSFGRVYKGTRQFDSLTVAIKEINTKKLEMKLKSTSVSKQIIDRAK